MKSLDQILLRLPAVRDMVESLRVEFAKAHTTGSAKGDQIALADFAASAEALHLKLPDETLKDVLAAADVDGDHMISFKARGQRVRGGAGCGTRSRAARGADTRLLRGPARRSSQCCSCSAGCCACVPARALRSPTADSDPNPRCPPQRSRSLPPRAACPGWTRR